VYDSKQVTLAIVFEKKKYVGLPDPPYSKLWVFSYNTDPQRLFYGLSFWICKLEWCDPVALLFTAAKTRAQQTCKHVALFGKQRPRAAALHRTQRKHKAYTLGEHSEVCS